MISNFFELTYALFESCNFLAQTSGSIKGLAISLLQWASIGGWLAVYGVGGTRIDLKLRGKHSVGRS